jgi:hypothetical protein
MAEADTVDVRSVVRWKIDAGTLLTATPEKVWVGPGVGEPCSACDLVVAATDIEYEIDLPGGRALRFHQKCLAVWHAERVKSRAS